MLPFWEKINTRVRLVSLKYHYRMQEILQYFSWKYFSDQTFKFYYLALMMVKTKTNNKILVYYHIQKIHPQKILFLHILYSNSVRLISVFYNI